MAFWNSEILKQRIPAETLVDPYNEGHVKHCAYELSMGAEAFITSSDGRTKIVLENGESLVIPPGQLALLLTEEKVTIPVDAIGFISMRFGVKKRGLINVSGFHVDPGFSGRLKFAVYNAGSGEVTVSRGDRVFVLWFARLLGATADSYGGEKADHNVITSADQNVLHGDIASPAQLKREIDDVRQFYKNTSWVLGMIAALLAAIFVRVLFLAGSGDSGRSIKSLRESIVEEACQEMESRRRNVRDDLGRLNSSFALLCFRKDHEGLAGMYTETARLVHSEAGEAVGRDAIETFWRQRLGTDFVALQLEVGQIEPVGETLVETGMYSFVGSDTKVAESGRYFVVWRRVEGEWKRHRESWSRIGKSLP